LCSVGSVRVTAGISSEYSDITDADIQNFINAAESYVYDNYYPIVRTKVNIDDQATTAGSLTIKFTPDHTDYSVYAVGSIYFDGIPMTEVTGSTVGSFTIDKEAGKIKFSNDTLLTLYDSIDFEFVPTVFNKLATAYASMDVLDLQSIVTGKDTPNTKTDKLDKMVIRFEESLRPKGAFMSYSGGITSGRVFTVTNQFDDVKLY
jgi:hypothetical protein